MQSASRVSASVDRGNPPLHSAFDEHLSNAVALLALAECQVAASRQLKNSGQLTFSAGRSGRLRSEKVILTFYGLGKVRDKVRTVDAVLNIAATI